jgi:hypothetical protein
MSKLNIKLVFLGSPPNSINSSILQKWESKLFRVIDPIDKLSITSNADLEGWGFSDNNIANMLPSKHDGDIRIAITSVPLEENYYARRLSNNTICITFFDVIDFLRFENIPSENFILRVLYSACLVYKRYNLTIPPTSQATNFTHDETRGCIFDMNGIKNEIIYSTNKPIICEECSHNLKTSKIEINLIDSIKSELKNIRKGLYYRIVDLIKMYPIWAIILSSLTAIFLGIIGSLIAAYLWEIAIKKWLNV